MPLRLTLRTQTSIPLEVEGITPNALRGKSLAEVERLEIFEGNVKSHLADFFKVSGNTSDDIHQWAGDLTGVHWLGAKMEAGRIVVEGHAGRHVGSEMRGGEIYVQGNASDWVGAEMHGGLIYIHGRAGHLVGAAYGGSPIGMTKGTILVGGDAGDEIGRSLRRGLIAVGGSIGDFAGYSMLAGSIFAFGECGARHGAGMKRGTIGLFGNSRPQLLPTFRHACRYRPNVLPLLFRHLRRLDFAVPANLLDRELDLFNGDFLTGGRGELLLLAN